MHLGIDVNKRVEKTDNKMHSRRGYEELTNRKHLRVLIIALVANNYLPLFDEVIYLYNS